MMMQKEKRVDVEETKEKKADVPEDEMAALERRLSDNYTLKHGERFVSAGVISHSTGEKDHPAANQEDIELLDDDDKVEISQKEVPSAVFGGLARKREEEEEEEDGINGGAKKDNGRTQVRKLKPWNV